MEMTATPAVGGSDLIAFNDMNSTDFNMDTGRRVNQAYTIDVNEYQRDSLTEGNGGQSRARAKYHRIEAKERARCRRQQCSGYGPSACSI